MDLHCYGKSHYHHPIRSAKRKLYQQDLEENHAAEKQKYEDKSDSILASKRSRFWKDPEGVQFAKCVQYKTQKQAPKRHRGLKTTNKTTTKRYVIAWSGYMYCTLGLCACIMCNL